MRLNYIGGASTTGGTGALTLTATEGLALPSLGFVDGQMIDYSIVQFTDATKTTIARAETGVGTVISNVLTRSAPRTTWDGTTYSQASPGALSFAATNVRVYCTPNAEGGPTSFPARPDERGQFLPNGHIMGANISSSNTPVEVYLIPNRQWMVPLKLEAGFALNQIGIQVLTAAAASTVHCAIASCHPTTGMPGVILAAANDLDSSTTGFTLGAITSRLFAPGWYWQLISTGTAGVSVAGFNDFLPNFFGLASSRTVRGIHRGRTHAIYQVGVDAMAGSSGNYDSANFVPYPVIFMQ